MAEDWKSPTECIADEIMPLFPNSTYSLRVEVEKAINRGTAKYQAQRKAAKSDTKPATRS